jgi:hypothetical protein
MGTERIGPASVARTRAQIAAWPKTRLGVPAGYLRQEVVFEMQLNAPQVEQALVHMLA